MSAIICPLRICGTSRHGHDKHSPQTGGTGVASTFMAKRLLVPRSEAEQMLRKAGYPPEVIENVMRGLPDPLDSERDAGAFTKWGISFEALMDRLGASP